MNEYIDVTDPVIGEALKKAQDFNDFCRLNNLQRSLILDGVALDADVIRKKAYEDGYLSGKEFEKGRISQLLGLIK